MYMLLFALLAVLSGWATWRHNPLFSARATLRFLVAVGSMLAVVIFVIVKVSDYSVHAPPARAYTALFATILFATAAMIWVIMAVSNPKSAPLPATVKRVHVYRKRVVVWAKRLAVSLLVLGLLAIVLPPTGRILIGVVGGMLAFIGVICLFAYYLSTRQMDLWLSAIEADPWVHWTYTPRQWQQWTDAEVARTPSTPAFQWRTGWKKAVLYLGGTCAAIMIFDPGPWYYRAGYCGAFLLLIAGIAWLGRNSDKQAPQRVRASLVKAPLEVYFGSEGLFADGDFTPWLTIGNYLLDASIDERAPRSLLLQFEKIVPSGYGGNGVIMVKQYVPLPEGKDVSADLTRLQQELTAKCPTAQVNLG